MSNATRPPENLKLKTENDSELNRVFKYSSPKHNGVYVPENHSIFENVTNVNSFDEVKLLNDSWYWNETSDVSVEIVNGSEECGVANFVRSYASWHDGDKRRRIVQRSSSINLRAPVSYR